MFRSQLKPAQRAHYQEVAGAAPTVNDDASAGFSVGDNWLNTSILEAYECLDNTNGAAVWKKLSNRRHNIDVVRPTIDDDITKGYEVASLWFDSVTNELFVNIDATAGASLWRIIGGVGTHVLSGLVFYGGSLLDYPTIASDQDNEIQFIAVRLQVGKIYDRLVVFVDSGGLDGRTIQLGVYDQVAPSTITDPQDLIATTDSVSTAGTNSTYFEVPITDGAGTPQTYTVTADGIYWLAMVQSSNAVKFASTAIFRAGILPRRRQSGGSSLLPASASGLSNPAAALILVALVEVGTVIGS